MTSNRIEYYKAVETERHNRATEGIQKESNRISEEHYKRSDAAAALQAKASWENAVTNRVNCFVNAAVSFSQIEYNKAKTQQTIVETDISQKKLKLSQMEYQHKVEYDTAMIRFESRRTEATEKQAEASLKNAATNADKQNLAWTQYEENVREYNQDYKLRKKKNTSDLVNNYTSAVKNIKETFLGRGTGIIQWIQTSVAAGK